MARDTKRRDRVVEYSDETEEFSGISRSTIEIDGSYRYLHKNPFYKVLEFLVYRVIMMPFAFLYCKLKFRYRVVNRKALRSVGKAGYFVYSNHTLMAGDAFLPTLVSFPRRVRVIVHADNVSVRLTKRFIECSGALPLPTKLSGMPHLLSALEHYVGRGEVVQVYPEAHIWPYYTGIRAYPSTGFVYPARLNSPVFSATVTYRKKGLRRTPAVTVYLDGPFYPDGSLPERKAAQKLRDEVLSAMTARAENNTYAAVKYVKKETGKESAI